MSMFWPSSSTWAAQERSPSNWQEFLKLTEPLGCQTHKTRTGFVDASICLYLLPEETIVFLACINMEKDKNTMVEDLEIYGDIGWQ